MQRSKIHYRGMEPSPASRKAKANYSVVWFVKSGIPLVCLCALVMLSGCGGSSSTTNNSSGTGQIAGNWQFTMASPSDGSFLGGIQGGFLLQNKDSVTGGVVYNIQL